MQHLTHTDKPVLIAILGPKGSGKTTLANALGFPQYQFNQFAIERLSSAYGEPESTFKDAEVKDKLITWNPAAIPDQGKLFESTPRQLIIDSIEDALATNKEGYIEDNFQHFVTWLSQADNYFVTLPSIRREFEVDYLVALAKEGYDVLVLNLEREGCAYEPEGGEVTEQNLYSQLEARLKEITAEDANLAEGEEQTLAGATISNHPEATPKGLAIATLACITAMLT